MKAKKLSANILKNTVRGWGMHCKNDPNCNWTKHDENALKLLDQEVKERIKLIYQKQKAIKMNPYLDPDQPYHTT